MSCSKPWCIGALLVLAASSSAAPAHDDDPKILDVQPAYTGPGIRNGQWTNGSGPANSSMFPAQGVQLLSWMTLPDLHPSATSAADCWGYVAPSGREYALVGVSNGTAIVEITDPVNPKLVKHLSGPNSLWHGLKVYKTYAYAVSEGGQGIQVLDLGQIDSGTASQVGSITTPGTTATHTVAVDADSGFLYRCGGGGEGIRIYDLNANPASPAYVGKWSTKYVHEAQIVTYTSGPAAGKQIAYACTGFNGGWSQPGLTILDVTDKANITVVKEVFWPQGGYSHQCWLSEDRKYLYLGDELDEQNFNMTTRRLVFDVSDPANAFYVGSFTNGNKAIDHNAYVRGSLYYCADYRAGLRVWDLTNPVVPAEVAFFDTWPPDDNANFNSLWTIYPFFPSKVVAGADVEKGLFLWWVPNPLNPAKTYCTAKVNSQGCTPSLTLEGGASLSAPAPFNITATNVINQKSGLLFYGFGSAAFPFHGGTMCVQSPITRTQVQNSAGNGPPDDCSGGFVYDFNDRIQSGIDPALSAGTTVFAQFWYRDPVAPFGDGLSNATEFTIEP
jgi:choice-of-anchor B domain-containing protein